MEQILSKTDRIRYSRNILLEGFGENGQHKLANASVIIVGTGALGSVVAMYLAASGIGKIGLCDFDTIDLSNLQRQFSFTTDDVGKSKVKTLSKKISDINPGIEIDVYEKFIDRKSAGTIFPGYDIIVEASDNPATKYLVTDTARLLGKPCVFGGVAQYLGQVTTFMPDSIPYHEIFPYDEADNGLLPCNIGGVLGPLPGVIGSIQAIEVIKLLAGIGKPLVGRLLLYDSFSASTNIINF